MSIYNTYNCVFYNHSYTCFLHFACLFSQPVQYTWLKNVRKGATKLELYANEGF